MTGSDMTGSAKREADDDLVGVFYSLVALEQPLTVAELAEGSATRTFPALSTRTPEWFAAAASGSDLLAMAPELQALHSQVDADEAPTGSPAVDLIHVYAPEMAVLEDLEDDEDEDDGVESSAPVPEARPGAGTQIGLLKELNDLDE